MIEFEMMIMVHLLVVELLLVGILVAICCFSTQILKIKVDSLKEVKQLTK
jgi:hypothetical protein